MKDPEDELLTREQAALKNAMSDLSEEAYCAGWMADAEYDIWRLMQEGGSWGMGAYELDDPRLVLIRTMHTVTGSWIVWEDGPRAVATTEWAPMYAEWKARMDAWLAARTGRGAQ